jgi:hypothetical protein
MISYYFTDLHLHYHKHSEDPEDHENYKDHKEEHRILPFCLQMNILSYSSRLPNLPSLFWEYMRSHYDRRVCRFCGRFLPMENATFMCLCHRRCGHRGKKKFKAFEFDDDLMNRSRCWKTRSCPGIIYRKPTIPYVHYVYDLYDYPDVVTSENQIVFSEDDWYFLTSCQPMVIISFLYFCRLPWHTYKSFSILKNIKHFLLQLETRSKTTNNFHPNWLFHRVINTNTLLRSFADTFHSQETNKRGIFYSMDDCYYPGVRLFYTLEKNKSLTQNTGIISLRDFMKYEYSINRLTYPINISSMNQQSHYFFHGK